MRLKGSGEKELVACDDNGILAARGRLNCAEGCNKNLMMAPNNKNGGVVVRECVACNQAAKEN